jgi:hypothetical protein
MDEVGRFADELDEADDLLEYADDLTDDEDDDQYQRAQMPSSRGNLKTMIAEKRAVGARQRIYVAAKAEADDAREMLVREQRRGDRRGALAAEARMVQAQQEETKALLATERDRGRSATVNRFFKQREAVQNQRAKTFARAERKTAATIKKRVDTKMAQKWHKNEAVRAKARHQIQQAEAGQVYARAMMRESTARTKEVRQQLNDAQEQDRRRRVMAMLELKVNSDASYVSMVQNTQRKQMRDLNKEARFMKGVMAKYRQEEDDGRGAEREEGGRAGAGAGASATAVAAALGDSHAMRRAYQVSSSKQQTVKAKTEQQKRAEDIRQMVQREMGGKPIVVLQDEEPNKPRKAKLRVHVMDADGGTYILGSNSRMPSTK